MDDDDFAICGHYLDKPFPAIDVEEFKEFLRKEDLHFKERKKCKHWWRVMTTNLAITGERFLSHFGDCHNPDNKTHNCGYNLCPIRDGDIYNHNK